MAYFFKFCLLAVLFVANVGVSFGRVPGWDEIGDCARACISSSLCAVLEDSGWETRNEVCSAPSTTTTPAANTPQCHDFCTDPAYNSSLTRCLKINCPRWVVGEILLLSNHIICNMSERQNLNFISDGPGSWSVHWPKSLDATGTETVISDPAHPTGGFGHPWAPTGVRRALHGEFPGYHVVAESTTTNPANGTALSVTSVSNMTTTSTCTSIAIATTVVYITITPASSTTIAGVTIFPSTSCSCNSTSTFTTHVFTTLTASSVLTTVPTTSPPSSFPQVSSFHSTTVTTTHSTATISLPPLHTETGAAVAVSLKSKLLALGAGGAGILMIGLL